MIVVGNKIQIEPFETTAGDLDLSSNPTMIESGKIIAINDDLEKGMHYQGVYYKVGDIILFKSWALDVITYQGKQYYFIDADSKSICAVINENRNSKN